MHALDLDGNVIKGVDAFALIWKEFPHYKKWSLFIQLPGIHFIAKIFYFIFARLIRPYLPKKKACKIN
jgi:hypothetical protein